MIFTDFLTTAIEDAEFLHTKMLHETARYFAKMCDDIEEAAGVKFKLPPDCYDDTEAEKKYLTSMQMDLGSVELTPKGHDTIEEGQIILVIDSIPKYISRVFDVRADEDLLKKISEYDFGVKICIYKPRLSDDGECVTYDIINSFRFYMRKYDWGDNNFELVRRYDDARDDSILVKEEHSVEKAADPKNNKLVCTLTEMDQTRLMDGYDDVPEEFQDAYYDIMQVVEEYWARL